MSVTLVRATCGHPVQPSGITTGYARTNDGRVLCYSCADDEQRADLTTTDVVTQYLSSDERTVTTWTGGRLMDVTQVTHAPGVGFGGHLPASERGRRYVRATDIHGAAWHGSGPRSADCVTMRRAVVR